MKRRYQIRQQRAVNEFRQLARNQNLNVQMVLPWPNRRSVAGRGDLAAPAPLVTDM